MNVDRIREIINEKPNLSTALGMEFVSTPEDDTCMARMKVDERNRGVGSCSICPGCACVGIEVSGSHVQAVSEGDTVTAFATLLHKGTTLHVWNVDIRNSLGDLISNVRVTNYVINPKR